MSYIQGTRVKATFTVLDSDTGKPYDPPSVQVKVQRPTGIDLYTLAAGTVFRLIDPATSQPIVGKYRAIIDTSVEPGNYSYEVSIGGTSAVYKRRSFWVDSSLP